MSARSNQILIRIVAQKEQAKLICNFITGVIKMIYEKSDQQTSLRKEVIVSSR